MGGIVTKDRTDGATPSGRVTCLGAFKVWDSDSSFGNCQLAIYDKQYNSVGDFFRTSRKVDMILHHVFQNAADLFCQASK